MSEHAWTIHIDGASRGNPGPAAAAYIIDRPGHAPEEHAEQLGRATNNVAEYTALIHALERAAELGAHRLSIHSDSELLVKQMNGEYKVKNLDMRALHAEAQELISHFDKVNIHHVRREQNKRADALCNEALDAKKAHVAGPAHAAQPALSLEERVRDNALECLRSAAAVWARGNAAQPAPELVWEQLWSLLEEANVLKAPKRK